MERRQFVTKMISAAGATVALRMAALSGHIKHQLMKNSVMHRANTRGVADLGWLKSYHTFSFSHYYNPDRMNFGALRVLNDDTVAPGMGFGKHPHNNMEIISIPLQGDLQHQDSMGNETVIRKGDIQIMSAGTGVEHSEYNHNQDQEVQFLQIWIVPNQREVKPRYDQITLNPFDREGKFQQILSPNADDEGVWIHQDAWFHLGTFKKGDKISYELKKTGNGIYAFILAGSVVINKEQLERRDGYGLWDVRKMDIEATSDAEVLLIEVPMNL